MGHLEPVWTIWDSLDNFWSQSVPDYLFHHVIIQGKTYLGPKGQKVSQSVPNDQSDRR